MSSSFFLKNAPKTNKKRKQINENAATTSAKKGKITKGKNKVTKPTPTKKRPQKKAEEIPSEDEDNSDLDNLDAPNLVFSSDEGETETAQDKRLRLAKQYLEEIERQEAERAEERDIHDHVAQRLKTEYLDSVGRLRRQIADNIIGYEVNEVKILKHKLQHLPVCALALTADGKYLFTGAKTQHVLKWDLEKLKVIGTFNVQPYAEELKTSKENNKKRRSHVIAMCLSSDNKYLALAEGGNSIQIWCPQELKHLKTFTGHRDIVTTLVFRRDTHELYSGSKDRSLKIWSLTEMAYVESLFGHQAGITSIDALSRERAITAGGIDATLRIWKITEESQLIYNGPQGSIEHVKFLNDENFISGSDNGTLCLWSAMKKKPLHAETNTHGLQENNTPNWITALSCLVNTDVVATGSCDGHIRLWRTADNARKLQALLEIPVSGFVNALAFSVDGSKLYAAVGQEHALGRWWRMPTAKNCVMVITLKLKDVEQAGQQVKENKS